MSNKHPQIYSEIKSQFQHYLSIPESEIHLKALPPGLTSQSYRVDISDKPTYVIRIPAEKSFEHGIIRTVEAAYAKMAASQGIGFEVIDYWPKEERLITRFVKGQHLEPMDEIEPSLLYVIIETLSKLHNGPMPADPGRFQVFDVIRKSIERSKHYSVILPEDTSTVLKHLTDIENALQTRQTTIQPCHNDLLPTNFLEHEDDLFLLDWEYGGAGDIFYDLGNLSVNFQLSPEGCLRLLEGYFGNFSDADYAHFQLMRLVSDIREGFWSYLQSAFPMDDNDFISYGNTFIQQFLEGTQSTEYQQWLNDVVKDPKPAQNVMKG